MGTEHSIYIPSLDMTFAWIQHGQTTKPAVIGLHGWLDNAATYDLISPYFEEFCFYSLDLAGHGKSDHLPLAAHYSVLEYASYVIEFVDAMNISQFHLIGHSMGACIASLLAGAVPDRILSAVLIEGLGPLTRGETESVEHFQKYLGRRRKKLNAIMPKYPSVADAVAARIRGSQISPLGAEILSRRGIKEIPSGYTWRSDVRLTHESAMRLTESQARAFLNRIQCPVLLVSGKDGYEHGTHGYGHRIVEVKNLRHARLPGNHHLHLDHPDVVGPAIREFLISCF